jgi:hypothetical protein
MVTQNFKKCSASYYFNIISAFKYTLGADHIVLKKQAIIINGYLYPVVKGLVVLMDLAQYPSFLGPSTSEYC